MQLEGRTAIITGGADGIGAGLTRTFVREGAKVLFVDIQEEKGHALESELGGSAKFLKEDLAAPGMAGRIVASAARTFGDRIDVLVNNGQAASPKLLLDADQASIDLAMDTGVWASFHLMRACHKALAASKGSIINFGSSAGLEGTPTHGAYAMSKEAIRGLTRTAANEWGADGIRVNVLCPQAASPGFVWWSEQNPEAARQAKARVPLGRIGDVMDDIAPVVVFLASDASRYMTGQTLMADGGSTKLR